jgi:CMP-N,N'-diacetyllegionaminic acid synthase
MILGTICCRGGSKGVLGKNIRLLNGIPLMVYTIETAKKSTYLDDLIVSTDDSQIAEIAGMNGVTVPFIRPSHLASDTASKWPVFIHAVEHYEKTTGNIVSYIVDMDVTVPLKTAQDIDSAIQMAISNPEADVVITGYESERNPYFNMMESKISGFAEIVKKPDLPIVRRQDAPKVFSLTPAAYVIKKQALYQYEHWSEAKCMISEMPRARAIDIDTEFDFKLIEFMTNGK